MYPHINQIKVWEYYLNKEEIKHGVQTPEKLEHEDN